MSSLASSGDDAHAESYKIDFTNFPAPGPEGGMSHSGRSELAWDVNYFKAWKGDCYDFQDTVGSFSVLRRP